MTPDHRRILIADDLPSIHEDYRKILSPALPARPALASFSAFAPFAAATAADPSGIFELHCVLQGERAVAAAAEARVAGRPFALAFIDVRMPPGIDGVETAFRLRQLDPDLQIVLCTAYSDYSLADIARRFPDSDGILVLKKPFDPVEVQQLARSLCRKWRLAAEHRALLADLEAAVAARTVELADAKAKLEIALRAAQSANRAKSEFLANMSHEIRTPLNAVLGMAELLQASPLSAAQREFTDTIRTSGDTLLSVINEILDFSKIEQGQIELERSPLDLRACVQDAVDIAAPRSTVPRAVEIRTELAPDLPPLILGDAFRLRQILVNLVSNAVKFTERGEIIVSLSRLPVDTANPASGERLLLSVRDTGIGIPPDRQDRLFQAFSQIDASTTRKYGGTGLGLAIAHRIVSLMGGAIRVESTPGQGSEFRVELPLAFAPAATPAAPAPATEFPLDTRFARRFPLRILLVEDNAVNQRVAHLLLQKLGYSPAFAVHGAEALEAIARETFDIVLLDVQMPVMDGLECARRLRADYADHSRPWIIAMTANALEGDREICLAAGMDDYTSKPVRLPVVAEALRRGHDALSARRAPSHDASRT